MPTPRTPRHTAPHHPRLTAPHPPHRHITRVPSPLLPSIRYSLATLYRLAILDLYIRTSPRPTSSLPYSTSIYVPRPDLQPHALIASSAALSTLPHSFSPLFCTFSPHPQHLTAILLHSFPPLFHTLSPHPQHLAAILLHSSPPLFRVPFRPSFAEKFTLPRIKQAVTHLWKSFVPKEEEDLSSTSYPDDIVWITL